MTIGIDVRPLAGASGRRGVGSYVRGLLRGLAGAVTGGDRVVLFGNGGEQGDAPEGFEKVVLSRPTRGITLWDQIAWPSLLARRGVDVFHSPFYAIPRLRPRRCAVVQTIHDLTPLKFPGAVSPRHARLFRVNFLLARSADRIIVPSRATHGDVVALLRVEARRVAVVPEAADVEADDLAEADRRLPQVRRRLGLPEGRRYLLHAGGHDVVKNLPTLLEAFEKLVLEGRDLDLVVAGEHGAGTPALIARAAQRGVLARLRLPGWVPRADLLALYRGAAAMIYPSLAEGFGLPILEAMACGAPVVASLAGSIPEVAGEACLLVPPADAAAFASAAASILDDPEREAALRRGGQARAALFSWQEAGRRTLSIYREAAA
ncbi:MAG TPA: glycosyltransferase family 1 protein [Candidatus Polarisedimenticolia bacterium]|nr:glycosyltransferase family 1 protein [Candidatus Polarisedimenticolia bacterium]